MNPIGGLLAAARFITGRWWLRWGGGRHWPDTVPVHLEACPTCSCDRESVAADR